MLYTYREIGADLRAADGHPERVRVLRVNAEYFQTLGATPLLGRTFTRDEERAEAHTVILSHRLWKDFAAGDPTIIGRTIDLSGESMQVIGVMRPTFQDLAGSDVAAWTPIDLVPGRRDPAWQSLSLSHRSPQAGCDARSGARRGARLRCATGRAVPARRPGAIRETHQHPPLAAKTSWATRDRRCTFSWAPPGSSCSSPASTWPTSSSREAWRIRERPRCVPRLAPGARDSWDSGSCESALVAIGGGLVGSATAYWGVKLLLRISPESLARSESLHLDSTLFGFALVVTALTALLFGAAPAIRAAHADPQDALREVVAGALAGTEVATRCAASSSPARSRSRSSSSSAPGSSSGPSPRRCIATSASRRPTSRPSRSTSRRRDMTTRRRGCASTTSSRRASRRSPG